MKSRLLADMNLRGTRDGLQKGPRKSNSSSFCGGKHLGLPPPCPRQHQVDPFLRARLSTAHPPAQGLEEAMGKRDPKRDREAGHSGKKPC